MKAGVETHSPERIAAQAPASRRRDRAALLLSILLLGFLALEYLVPLRTAVQIGADEGFELAKATLWASGHNVYNEGWNDQPPLHTFLVMQIIKHAGFTVLWPRLLTLGFSLVLLAAVFLLQWRFSGQFVAVLGTALLIASPGFVELASSCMLEMPSLATALAAIAILAAGGGTSTWCAAEVASGLLYGAALQMKLVPGYLLPMAVLMILQPQARGRGLGAASLRILVFGSALLASFLLTDLLIERGAYLLHFGQTWASHFSAGKSFQFGSAAEHPFDLSLVWKNWDATVPTLFFSCYLLGQWFDRKSKGSSPKAGQIDAGFFPDLTRWGLANLPLLWLALAFTIFVFHRPWWPYYYVHTAIPLCWCAALGVQAILLKRTERHGRVAILALSVFGLCALPWMGARLYLQISGIRASDQTYSQPVIREIARFRPFTQYMYTDRQVYSFYSGIPMPPQLAVLPLKRFWAGEMSNERLAYEVKAANPGVIQLPNDGQPTVFDPLLSAKYRLVYEDPENRLYVLISIAQKGLPPDEF